MEAKAGSRVVIHGLKNAAQYNGMRARVLSVLPDSKLLVLLDRNDAGEQKELKISCGNVNVAPAPSVFFRGGLQGQQSGQHEEALPMFHECMRAAMEDGDVSQACAALAAAASSCLALKRYDEAESALRVCLKLSEDSGNVAGQAETTRNIGNLYSEQGLSSVVHREKGPHGSTATIKLTHRVLSEAQASYAKSLEILGRVGDRRQQCDICFQLGGALYLQGSLSLALETFELLQKAAEATQNERMHSAGISNRAACLLKLDRFQDAFELYSELLAFGERTGQETFVGQAYTGMGNVYSAQGRTLQAVGMHEKRLALAKKMGSDADQATALGNLAFLKNNLGEHAEAMRLMEQDLTIRERMGDKLSEGEACIGLAELCAADADYDRSLSLYERVLRMHSEQNLAILATRAAQGIADILRLRGESVAAKQKYEEVLQLSEATGDAPSRDNALMGMAHCLLDSCQWQEAIATLQQCLERAEQAGNVGRVISAREGLAAAYSFIGQTDKCKEQKDRLHELLEQSKYSTVMHEADRREDFERVLAVALERGNVPLQACTYRNLSTRHRNAGNFAESMRCTSKAYELCVQSGDEAGKRASLTQQATTALYFGQYPQAILTIRQLSVLGEDSESKTVMLNRLLAEAFVGLSLFRNAIKLYGSNLEFWERTGHVPMQAKTLKHIGDSLLLWRKYREALEHFEKSIALIESDGWGGADEAGGMRFAGVDAVQTVYGNAGQACFHLGEFEKTLAYYDRFLVASNLDADTSCVEAACFWTARGQAFLGMERREEAIESLYKALDRWEPSFDAFDVQDEANVAYFELQLGKVYLLLVPALVQVGRHEEALAVSERSKARAAEQLIRKRMSTQGSGAAVSSGEVSVQEVQEIVASESATLVEYFVSGDRLMIWVVAPGGAVSFEERSLAELERACGLELAALLEVTVRGMHAGGRNAEARRDSAGERVAGEDAESAAARQKALQKARDNAQGVRAFVEACEGGEDGEDPDTETLEALNRVPALPQYLQLMRRAQAQQTHVRKWLGNLPPPPEGEPGEWGAVVQAMQRQRLGWDDLQELTHEALENEHGVASVHVREHVLAQVKELFDEGRLLRLLHDALILPVHAAIENSEELIISPHSTLFTVPWAALLDSDGCYLIQTHTIRLVSSLRMAALHRSTPIDQRPARHAAVVGNPWPVASPVRPLPHAEMEAEQVLASLSQQCPLVRTQILTGANASKGRVKEILNDACWAHFACHCLLEEQALVLAGGAPKDSESTVYPVKNDSNSECNLTMEEVREGVAVQWGGTVVLSACSSAMGEIRGEGVLGLSRAFLCAGAAAVVVSLWSVDDYATKVLFRAFYAALQRGMSTQRAMQSAMLHVMGRERKGRGGESAQPPPAEEEGEWRSLFNAQGREEGRGLQLLFNGGRRFTYNGAPLGEGNGVNKRGMVTCEACEALFGVRMYAGDLWGKDGAVVKRARTCAEHVVTEALAHFDRSVTIRSGYQGILDTNHSFMLRALLQTTAQMREDLTQKALEQLAMDEEDGGGWTVVVRGQNAVESEGAPAERKNPLARPRLWSAFVIIGASTTLPTHQPGAETSEPGAGEERKSKVQELLSRGEGMSVDDVCAVLGLVELGEHADAFRENSIDGCMLGELEQLWGDLGVTKKAHQIKLRKTFGLA